MAKDLTWYKEHYKQDGQRVKYLVNRALGRVISPTEAQELTDLTHKHGKRNNEKFQYYLDKVIKRKYGTKQLIKTKSVLDRHNDNFDELSQKLDKKKIDASRTHILKSIQDIRKKYGFKKICDLNSIKN